MTPSILLTSERPSSKVIFLTVTDSVLSQALDQGEEFLVELHDLTAATQTESHLLTDHGEANNIPDNHTGRVLHSEAENSLRMPHSRVSMDHLLRKLSLSLIH